MNQNDSIGYVEVIGMVAAIKAADVMVKAANVKIETVANADSGLISVVCTGDLASCGAAIDAAKASVSEAGVVFGSNLIPRPSSDVENLIGSHIGTMLKKAAAKPATKPAAKKASAAKKTK